MTIALEVEVSGKSVVVHRLPDTTPTTVGRAPANGLSIPEARDLPANICW